MSYLTAIYNIVIALPKILALVKAIKKMVADINKAKKEIKNEQIQKDVENASSDTEAQAALDRAAGRFNK